MTRFAPVSALCVVLGVSGLRAATPVPQASAPRNDWISRHEEFLADAKARAGDIQIVFLGDSITARWTSGAGLQTWQKRYAPRAINLGISSDATQNVLWRVKNGELADLHPQMVVLLIGTNNLLRADPATVAYGVWSIVDEIRRTHPETRILVQGIFPRTDRKDLGDKIPAVNELLSHLDDGKMVKYIDFGSKFLQPDGTLAKESFPDGVHPETSEDFEIWADAIQPTIDDWLKTPPVTNVPPPAAPAKPANSTTSTPEARDEWMQTHNRCVAEENKLKPDLLFFGDGIMSVFNKAELKPLFDTTYGEYHPYNFSIVGNRPENLLWELQNGALDSVTPNLIVLHLQDSLNGSTPLPDLVEGTKAVVQTIKEKRPTARILLLGAFPSSSGTANAKVDNYNADLRELADEKTVWFFDPRDAIDKTSAPGIYPTYHHPDHQAYENWMKIQGPIIEKLMKNQ